MHLAVYALSIIAAVWFMATSLVAVRRSLQGRDLELHLAAVGDDARPVRARVADRSEVATAA